MKIRRCVTWGMFTITPLSETLHSYPCNILIVIFFLPNFVVSCKDDYCLPFALAWLASWVS